MSSVFSMHQFMNLQFLWKELCVCEYYTCRRIMSNVAIGHCRGHTNDCGLIASHFTFTKLISWIMGIIIFRKNTIY
jgi:hypothetical protein